MNITEMNLVGRKVECVDDRFSGGVHEWGDQLPHLGEIYTIRVVGVARDSHDVPGPCVKVEELKNPADLLWFSWWHFRLIEDAEVHEAAGAHLGKESTGVLQPIESVGERANCLNVTTPIKQRYTRMQIVSTPQGAIKLLPPTADLIRDLHSLLPFGLVSISEPGEGYRIVMQCGRAELRAVKQQPPDTDAQSAMALYRCNVILIAHALKRYLEHRFSGLLIPCAYLRAKATGNVESGVACFGFPAKGGREAIRIADKPAYTAYDSELGQGFTKMLIAFIRSLKISSQQVCLTQSPVIGLDIRRRLQLGSLSFGFAILDSRIICLKTRISEADPVWTALRLSGIDQVFHLPSVPAAIDEKLRASVKSQNS